MSSSSLIQIGAPTLDRPFGIQLWPLFEAAFSALKGYKPQDFRFVVGKTPFSTLSMMATMLTSYYVIIFGGREIMRSRQPMQLNGFFKVHNFYLTVISGVLLLLFAEQLIPTVARKGVFYSICNHGGGWTNELVILYYVCTIWRKARRSRELIFDSSITSPSTSN